MPEPQQLTAPFHKRFLKGYSLANRLPVSVSAEGVSRVPTAKYQMIFNRRASVLGTAGGEGCRTMPSFSTRTPASG
jgi:hypothetical protein